MALSDEHDAYVYYDQDEITPDDHDEDRIMFDGVYLLSTTRVGEMMNEYIKELGMTREAYELAMSDQQTQDLIDDQYPY